MTKTKHTSLSIGLAMLFLGAGATANAADATVYQTFIGGVNGNWNPTYFNLDKSQIAKGLGLTESELLEKAGTDVIVYSVKSDVQRWLQILNMPLMETIRVTGMMQMATLPLQAVTLADSIT